MDTCTDSQPEGHTGSPSQQVDGPPGGYQDHRLTQEKLTDRQQTDGTDPPTKHRLPRLAEPGEDGSLAHPKHREGQGAPTKELWAGERPKLTMVIPGL